jgi:hypothetical protein
MCPRVEMSSHAARLLLRREKVQPRRARPRHTSCVFPTVFKRSRSGPRAKIATLGEDTGHWTLDDGRWSPGGRLPGAYRDHDDEPIFGRGPRLLRAFPLLSQNPTNRAATRAPAFADSGGTLSQASRHSWSQKARLPATAQLAAIGRGLARGSSGVAESRRAGSPPILSSAPFASRVQQKRANRSRICQRSDLRGGPPVGAPAGSVTPVVVGWPWVVGRARVVSLQPTARSH